MANLSLPFSLARNNGEPVTKATEVDVTIGSTTMSVSKALSEITIDSDTWEGKTEAEQATILSQYTNVFITE